MASPCAGPVLRSQVTIVGQISNVATQTTNITYKLDDGTGSIEVKQWNDADAMETSPLKERLVEGAYCRAWGKLKDLGNRRHVNAQIVRPVDDMNEVSYHLLEATQVHLYITRGPVGGAGAAAGGGAAVNGAGQQGATGAYGGVDLSGYNAVAKRVYQYLREAPQSNEGLHQHEIAAKLGIDSGEVAKAGDAMLEGGLIYTTVDDQTWAILEAD
jgi:replication factor A2